MKWEVDHQHVVEGGDLFAGEVQDLFVRRKTPRGLDWEMECTIYVFFLAHANFLYRVDPNGRWVVGYLLGFAVLLFWFHFLF